MLVASVDVWLGTNAHDPVEVVDIHVNKDPVKPRQDLLTLRLETLGEGDICRYGKQLKRGKSSFVWKNICSQPVHHLSESPPNPSAVRCTGVRGGGQASCT